MLHQNKAMTEDDQLEASGARILIVDGLQSIGSLYAKILRTDGHAICTVSSAHEAKSVLATYRPALIVFTPDPFHTASDNFEGLPPLSLEGKPVPVLVISAMKNPLLKSNPFITECLFLPIKLNQLRECVDRLAA